MGVTRSQFTENYKKDLYGYFWDAYPTKPPRYEDIFDVVQSDAAYEQFSSAIGLGELLEKPESESIQSDTPMESYTIVCKNRSFARNVRFSYESVQDAKKTSNMLATVVGTWGRSLPTTKEKFYAKFFNYGAYSAGHDIFNNTITDVVSDSSGDKIYDSSAWFAEDHADKVGNTYDNYVGSTALSHANLKTVYNTYTSTNNRDERGQIIDLRPDVLLLPSGTLNFTAAEILNSVLVPEVTNNTTNVLKNIVDPMEWSFLDDADGWFLGAKKMGLMATDREDVSLDFYEDEDNMDYVARIFTRFGGCITNFRYWIAANISQS